MKFQCRKIKCRHLKTFPRAARGNHARAASTTSQRATQRVSNSRRADALFAARYAASAARHAASFSATASFFADKISASRKNKPTVKTAFLLATLIFLKSWCSVLALWKSFSAASMRFFARSLAPRKRSKSVRRPCPPRVSTGETVSPKSRASFSATASRMKSCILLGQRAASASETASGNISVNCFESFPISPKILSSLAEKSNTNFQLLT